jgi:DNA-binding response OmpR family regulator
MSELQRALDRIEELEELLGLNLKLPNEFDLTPTEMQCVGAIVRRGIVNQEAIYTAVYGSRPESQQPDIKIIDVYICKIRKKLAAKGYALKNNFGVGYYFAPGERDALKQLCAA